MIYTIDGDTIMTAYDVGGDDLSAAYDIDGGRVYDKAFALKVMAYNVGTWYLGNHDNVPAELDADYYALQSEIVESNDADVLLLEEYAKQFSKTGRTAKSMLKQYYPYIHEQGGDNPQASAAFGRCICSKYPITDYVVHDFNDGTGFYVDVCKITVNGRPITVGITHLHWNNINRRITEVGEILNLISDAEYAIVGGDYNTETFYSTSDADYVRVMKQFVDDGYSIVNGGSFGFISTYTSESTMTNMKCLDNFVTSANIGIDNAYVDTTKGTDSLVEKIDHLPLITELTVY